MRFTTLLTALTGLLAVTTTASPIASPHYPSPTTNHTLIIAPDAPHAPTPTLLHPLTFTGLASPSGPEVTLTGTIQSVHSQLLALNPDYDNTMLDVSSLPSDLRAALVNDTLPLPHTNGTTHPTKDRCDPNWDAEFDLPWGSEPADGRACRIRGRRASSSKAILVGISYLTALKGKCGIGAGPGHCTRISCSYNSAIWACNDWDYKVHLTCGHLAHYAMLIWRNSYRDMHSFDAEFCLKGQWFTQVGVNVVVKYDECYMRMQGKEDG